MPPRSAPLKMLVYSLSVATKRHSISLFDLRWGTCVELSVQSFFFVFCFFFGLADLQSANDCESALHIDLGL